MMAAALLAATLGTSPQLVELQRKIPDLVVDMRYATPDNFMKRQVYPTGAPCLAVPELADRLVKVADALRAKGFRLKVWDCYRPLAVQREMWKVMPHKGYVADPATGSHHNRGAAVDLTLVTLDGQPVEMPTPFDTFSHAAFQHYPGGTESSRKNRAILRDAMEAEQFKPNPMEWWHWELPDAVRFPLLDLPFG